MMKMRSQQWRRVPISFAVLLVMFANIAPALTNDVTDILEQPITAQTQILAQLGCFEGGEIGGLQGLIVATNELNEKYIKVKDFGKLSKNELDLVWQLTQANSCAAYYTGEKSYYLEGCELARKMAKYIAPAKAFDATTVCYDKEKTYTPAEQQQILRDSAEAGLIITRRTQASNDPKKNRYRFAYGRYLCAVNIDCQKGLQEMYEAALDEYREKGLEGFDARIVNNLSDLNNAAIMFKNAGAFSFVAQLQIALHGAGKLSINRGGLKYLTAYDKLLQKWDARGVTAAAHTKSLSELTAEQPVTVPIGAMPRIGRTAAGGASTTHTVTTPSSKPQAVVPPPSQSKQQPAAPVLAWLLWVIIGLVVLVVGGRLFLGGRR